MWASHTPPLSSVLGRPLALLERCLRAPPNNFDPSDATQAPNPLRWSYGSGDGAVITLVGVDGHRWKVSCLVVERCYERIRSLAFAHLCHRRTMSYLGFLSDQTIPICSTSIPERISQWVVRCCEGRARTRIGGIRLYQVLPDTWYRRGTFTF